MKKVYLLLWGFLLALFCSAQEKELLIIGTMHTVPKIVKHSYKPLLHCAVDYAPEAIYVEYIHPDDTLSINIYAPKFSEMSDSLKRVYSLDENRFVKIKNKRLAELTADDFSFLSQAYLLKRDQANYLYYKYLSQYGMGGTKKPLRNENEDLTFKLAVQMGITYLFPIDDHHSDEAYYEAWDQAMREAEKNGDIKILKNLQSKIRRGQVLAAFLGKLGKNTNSSKALERFYLINSFRFANHSNVYSDRVADLWEQRNQRMAENLVAHIMTNPYHKNVLIVGAGHVISLSKALKTICPKLKVILLCESDQESCDGLSGAN